MTSGAESIEQNHKSFGVAGVGVLIHHLMTLVLLKVPADEAVVCSSFLSIKI